MKKLQSITVIIFLFISTTTHAQLISRLGGQAYYDTESDLTWLTDATADGSRMNWHDANNWASNLIIDGVSGWRLPKTLQPDPSCSIQEEERGSVGYNCLGSEMGKLFYIVFGGDPKFGIGATHNIDNFRLFSKLIRTLFIGQN